MPSDIVGAHLEQMERDRGGVTLEELLAARRVLERQACTWCHRPVWGIIAVLGNGTSGHIWCQELMEARLHAQEMDERGPPR